MAQEHAPASSMTSVNRGVMVVLRGWEGRQDVPDVRLVGLGIEADPAGFLRQASPVTQLGDSIAEGGNCQATGTDPTRLSAFSTEYLDRRVPEKVRRETRVGAEGIGGGMRLIPAGLDRRGVGFRFWLDLQL